MQPILDLQMQMQQELGKPKREATYNLPNDDLVKKVYDRYKDKGFEIVGISLDRSRAESKEKSAGPPASSFVAAPAAVEK